MGKRKERPTTKASDPPGVSAKQTSGTIAEISTCKATRVDGRPCRARPQQNSSFCFWHDPDQRQQMLEASRKGGSRRTVELPEVEALTPERARSILAGLIEAVASGAVDASTGRSIGYLLSIEAAIREGYELQRRIEALEQAQAQIKAREILS